MKKTLKLLIASDLFIYIGLGLSSNLLSIFINNNLVGGTIAAAGLAAAVYLIVKSLSQIAFAKIFSPKDRKLMVLMGSVLIASTSFIYAYSTNLLHMFLAQAVYGLGAGLAAPAWMSMFILNINKKTPGLEWSIYSTLLGLGMGASAYIGGWLIAMWGFKPIFLLSGVFGVVGMLVLLGLMNEKVK